MICNVGHGRAEIAEAMAKASEGVAYVSAASYTNLSAVHLAVQGCAVASIFPE
jgi:adenosylmethionine-8-amino-7-oxononanoate aminotransferase